MDAAPTTFAALPVDPEVGLPVPFACGTDDPYGAPARRVRRPARSTSAG